jgi:hypothetical protein
MIRVEARSARREVIVSWARSRADVWEGEDAHGRFALLRRWLRRGSQRPSPSPAARACIEEARIAIRLGALDEAQAILLRSGGPVCLGPAGANLLGIICECRGLNSQARRWYGRAIRADRRYEPAQQNMRRLFELDTYGHCRDSASLGDEPTALAALLVTRRNAP